MSHVLIHLEDYLVKFFKLLYENVKAMFTRLSLMVFYSFTRGGGIMCPIIDLDKKGNHNIYKLYRNIVMTWLDKNSIQIRLGADIRCHWIVYLQCLSQHRLSHGAFILKRKMHAELPWEVGMRPVW